jgi:hypothetical protein
MLRIITTHLKRFKHEKRGVSNVIVVMLSLVILVIISANVILWSYKMNQLDWEKMNEDITITEVTRITNSSWFVAQNEYTVNKGSLANGTYQDTQTANNVYQTFQEGLPGAQQETLRPDSAGQYEQWPSEYPSDCAHWSLCDENAPDDDSTYVENTDVIMYLYVNADDETRTSWTRVGANPYLDAVDYTNYIHVSGNNKFAGDFGFADSGKSTETINSVTVQLYTKQSLASKNLEVFSWDGSTWTSLGVEATPTSWGWMNWTATTELDTWGKIDGAKIYVKSRSAAGTFEVDCARLQVDYTATDFTNDSYNLQDPAGSGTINWVRVYIRARLTAPGSSMIRTLTRTHGTDYTSSNITLSTSYQDNYTQYNTNPDTGSAWTWTEIASLEAGASSKRSGGANVRMTTVWVVVNYSSTSYTFDMNGTFAFDLSTYPLDYIQTAEVELKYRASDTGENWYLKAYKWTHTVYSDSGFNNTSGHTPTTGWDTYAVNLTDKWRSYVNDSGVMYVKMQDNQADANQTTVDIDFLAIRVVIDGAKFTFENEETLTSHLVSLWINNSTLHQRYNINVYINCADTTSYIRSDITLPSTPYTVKVVTERGNTAVFTSN